MMKKLALGLLLTSISGAAYAADLPAPPSAPYTKAPAIVSPLTNWSGFYIGAMGGYGKENSNDPLALKGGFAGGTVGYNWQFGQFVAGIEADGAWADINNSTTIAGVTVAQRSMHWRPCAAALASRSIKSCSTAPRAWRSRMPSSARPLSVSASATARP
jgi:outer membrane immunogenic protein